MPQDINFKSLIRPGWEALKTYWIPFISVQLFGVGIVVTYYTYPSFQNFCDLLGDLKNQGGVAFAALATLMSGGIIPEIIKSFLRPQHLPKPTRLEILHQISIFPASGVLVDLFYRLQTIIFGESDHWVTILCKVSLDQFVFTPFLALPFVITWFLWREHEFCLISALKALSWRLYLQRILPILIPNFFYWIPMTAIIYSLPSAVQFPMFLCANCGWSLILIFIARRQIEHIKN
ncbi:MAG: hypothetical protein AAF984_09130 [Verrucomicrobiota bacterium]